MQLFHSKVRAYVQSTLVFTAASEQLRVLYAQWFEKRYLTDDPHSWVPDRATVSQQASNLLEAQIEPALKDLDAQYASSLRALFLSLLVRLDALVAVSELLCGDKELGYLGNAADRKRIFDELDQNVSDTNQLMADTFDYYLYNRYEAREPDYACP